MSLESSNWDDCLEVTSISDIGMRRANNQDSYTVLLAEGVDAWKHRGHLFVVADGMGAHAAGELASKLAAEGVAHHYYKNSQVSPPEAILRAVQDTNEEIYKRGRANSEFHNMGTTCSCLLMLPQGAIVAHVGDSRVYLLRDHRLQQLTFDHSLVWEMRKAGHLKDNGTSGIPRNVITRSLGPSPEVQVDLEGPFEVRANDLFLVCSDGLLARVEEAEFGTILDLLPASEAAQFLVDLANARGGPDNCTMVITKVRGGSLVTGAERAAPLVVGASLRPKRKVHSYIWVTMGVALLWAAGLAIAGHYKSSLAAAAVAVAAGCVALYQRFEGAGRSVVALTGGRRLGDGPYVDVKCHSAQQTVLSLIRSIDRLVLEPVFDDEPRPDMSRFTACLQEAESKARNDQLADALRLGWVATKIFLGK
jgi:protein phosphatase